MYLMFLIIQSEDADVLTRRLNNAGVRVTRLNTIGGFSLVANVTCLVGAGGRGGEGDGNRAQDLPHPQALYQSIAIRCRAGPSSMAAPPIPSK